MVKLSLCVIVGKNEANELERCLKSVQGDLFDEIVVTTTQRDPEVRRVAKKYATKTPTFKWVKDFSAARNFCYNKATGDYIMWLDSDDEITPENYAKLVELKKTLGGYDYVLMTYDYAHDEKGVPTLTLPRERITKNLPTLRWEGPIHEYISTSRGMVSLDRTDISVSHRRTRKYDSTRNIEILKSVYDNGDASPRIKFYLAKDLYDSGAKEEASKIFVEYLKGPTDFDQNKVLACLRMYDYHLGLKETTEYLSYLRRATMFNDFYAEPYYYLGLHYLSIGDTNEAIVLFNKALTKNPIGLFGARPAFYTKFPLDKLTKIYFDKKDYSLSLHFVNKYLTLFPSDTHYIKNKKTLEHLLGAPSEQPVPSYTSKDLNLGWLVRHFNPEEPSQRIRRLNVHKALLEGGNSSALFTNYLTEDIDSFLKATKGVNVLVSSTFDNKEYELLSAAKARGVKVLVDINEDITQYPNVQRMLRLADGVITCSSELLKKVKPFCSRMAVIEDAVETPEVEHDYFKKNNRKPVALYMGMGGNSFLVTDHLKDVVSEAGYELKVCTEWDNADVKWELDTWQGVMADADVVLCPQRVSVQPAKSNIKAAQAMAFGVPVLASPLPAYLEFIDHGKNGYICEDKAEWGKALLELKDIKKSIQIGLNGKDAVEQFSLTNTASKWVSKATSILNAESSVPVAIDSAVTVAAKETVPVIIPVYNGVDYLKECITSIHLNTLYPYHIVLSDAGSDEKTWEYLRTLKGITVLGSPTTRLSFSEAVNAGVSAVGNPRFFTVLNSDVIVSKGWLTNLVEKMENTDRLAICGVLSNCDRGWLFDNSRDASTKHYDMVVNDSLELHPGMKLDKVKPHTDDLYRFMEKSNKSLKGTFVEQAWVAYYATIFAKAAWDDIGYLDPLFKSGCEDLDHCRRAKSLGYKIGQSLDSFVFHFGGISRGAYQEEDSTTYDKEDKYNHAALYTKWSKKEVIIYTGPAWEKWGREDVDGGMAGSETWAAELAAEFSKNGHKVTLFGDPKKEGADRDGVSYLHYSKLKEYVEYRYISLCILSRTCEPPKTLRMHTSHLYVMVHDVWLSSDRKYDTMKWAVSKFGVLSDWHKDFFSEHHSIPKEKTLLTFNGVRQELYSGVDHSLKLNRAVYSSSPDRGLELLLKAVPKIRESVPDFELDVAYGFHNWESMAKARGDKNSLGKIEELKSLLKQPGVNYLGRISKAELAEKQKLAKVWAFPTWFSETFCITGVENGMAGNAAITTPYAGLLTTLGDAACYVKGPEDGEVSASYHTEEYFNNFVAEVIKNLTDESYRRNNAEKMLQKVKGYTWEAAARQWSEEASL